MLKFSTAKVKAVITTVVVLLAGLIGAKTLKGLVETKFPQFAQYTTYGVLAASLAGTMVAKPLIKNVAQGGLLFGAVQLLNMFVPDGAAQYVPQINGLGGGQQMAALPEYEYEYEEDSGGGSMMP